MHLSMREAQREVQGIDRCSVDVVAHTSLGVTGKGAPAPPMLLWLVGGLRLCEGVVVVEVVVAVVASVGVSG